MRSTIHTALDTTPAELAFGRDMMLPMKFKADWKQIRLCKQTKLIKITLKKIKAF